MIVGPPQIRSNRAACCGSSSTSRPNTFKNVEQFRRILRRPMVRLNLTQRGRRAAVADDRPFAIPLPIAEPLSQHVLAADFVVPHGGRNAVDETGSHVQPPELEVVGEVVRERLKLPLFWCRRRPRPHFTLQACNITARGRRAAAHPGNRASRAVDPEGVARRAAAQSHPFRMRSGGNRRFPGVRDCVATPGCGVARFQRAGRGERKIPEPTTKRYFKFANAPQDTPAERRRWQRVPSRDLPSESRPFRAHRPDPRLAVPGGRFARRAESSCPLREFGE